MEGWLRCWCQVLFLDLGLDTSCVEVIHEFCFYSVWNWNLSLHFLFWYLHDSREILFDCSRLELICLHWKDIFHSVKIFAGLQAWIAVVFFLPWMWCFGTIECPSTDLGLRVCSSSSAQSVLNTRNKVAAKIRNSLCQEIFLLWETELFEMLALLHLCSVQIFDLTVSWVFIPLCYIISKCLFTVVRWFSFVSSSTCIVALLFWWLLELMFQAQEDANQWVIPACYLNYVYSYWLLSPI